ncbi:HAD hydrolase-like protein [Alisedimentitalea sp. MJ-SS2]|uniref:HAD hydrolase-like protein n=1 Tax=Aliisedimentitalea sp. MJ-SS2 TaxID=3049795 RepID=UPI00291157A4|nr:HAD hydrolase-like protein [Alisedimentitalea sp. MJ-SS2]MDU8929482.1 HAD hydrolase-like protein [Alisedimentitalea sp. MJ-SS2]
MAHVFLDLDGTLTDSRPGIIRSFLHALEVLGIEAPDPGELDWVIGPALVDSFARLGVEDVQVALRHYRARYTDVGLFENELYAGVEAALAALRDAGHLLYLATAKPHAYATRITEHFGLSRFMTHEFGPELDGTRNDKSELLAHALEVTGAEAGQSVMVGDRHHDMDAARSVGMTAVAVRWGYGRPEEWSGAAAICDLMSDLPDVVARVLGEGR